MCTCLSSLAAIEAFEVSPPEFLGMDKRFGGIQFVDSGETVKQQQQFLWLVSFQDAIVKLTAAEILIARHIKI